MEGEKVPPTVAKKESVVVKPRRPQLVIPRRTPSVVVVKEDYYIPTADKSTCLECPCYPKEDPYWKSLKLNQCQKSPLTLYEYAAEVVDRLKYPEAFTWSIEDVAQWICDIGLPEYKECIIDNKINGRRLLLLEDPSHGPIINIINFRHVQMITAAVRKLFGLDFIRFTRSVGLPPRKPLTHCTAFKSRTGPTWGIRQNWTRCDILRWMKIIMPKPVHLDHWDLVWYHKPDFPKVKFGNTVRPPTQVHIPHYKPMKEVCREYLVKRRFRLQQSIADDEQLIWMERQKYPEEKKAEKPKVTPRKKVKSRLEAVKVTLEGKRGDELILARRKMNRPKFLA